MNSRIGPYGQNWHDDGLPKGRMVYFDGGQQEEVFDTAGSDLDMAGLVEAYMGSPVDCDERVIVVSARDIIHSIALGIGHDGSLWAVDRRTDDDEIFEPEELAQVTIGRPWDSPLGEFPNVASVTVPRTMRRYDDPSLDTRDWHYSPGAPLTSELYFELFD